MTCVCSLAGTAACKTCWHNPDSTGQSNNFVSWNTTSNYGIQRKNEMSYEDTLILLDELGLSERTCQIDYERHCSNCGAYVRDDSVLVRKDLDDGAWAVVSKPVNYCPNCGAKVVVEC